MTLGGLARARPSVPSQARLSPPLLLGFALLAGLTLAPGEDAAARDRAGPATSRGDIRFTIDTASFPSDGPDTREEVYLQIPSTELDFKESGKDLMARVEVAVTFKDTSGVTIAERKAETVLPVTSEAESRDPAEVHVLQSEFSLAPGPYRLEVHLTDLESREAAVPILLFIRRHASGEAALPIDVPAYPDSGLSVSDIQFARDIQENDEESPFRKGRFAVTPCADRVFGLLIPELRLYYEISDRLDQDAGEGELVEVSYELRTKTDAIVAARQEDLALHEGTNWARTAVFDLSTVPAGQYRVAVNIAKPSTGEAATTSATFDIVWSAYSWNKKLDDLLAELSTIASSEDQKKLKKLSSGERENFLTQFWKSIDPTPDTPRNEAFEEHYRRVRIADRIFTGRTRGISTDRGRIFVRYGPPDETYTGFATEEFIGSYLWQPKDEFNMREEGRARGGYNYKDKAYEIWTYDDRGNQLGAGAHIGTGVGLKFVFVDLSGYGDYEMVHSSEVVEY